MNAQISSIICTTEVDAEGRVIAVKVEWPTDRAQISEALIQSARVGAVVIVEGYVYLSPFSLRIVGRGSGNSYIVERDPVL